MLFANLEPFGSEAYYYGHAIVAQTVANAHRTKGQRPFKAIDFLPKFEKEVQSMEQMMQFASMLTASLGGEDLRSDE